ncbi:hypothetical protein B8P98_08000 [Klebsiella quasivariicola]|nr:hypothetical protein B8P98_08000 [Klebsiella quasivariicola]
MFHAIKMRMIIKFIWDGDNDCCDRREQLLAGNEIRASENEIEPAIKNSTRMQLLKPLRNITKVDV